MRSSRSSRRRHATAQPSPRAGFTLIEIILSLAILTLLMGMSIMSFAALTRGSDLDAGTLQFEGMLRSARADAARTGRRIRLAFVEPGSGAPGEGKFVIEWEPDPLGEPGVFKAYRGAGWTARLPDELVRVTSCRLTGPSAYRTLSLANPDAVENPDALEAVTFYPDGSCDWASIELASVDETDARRALIDLNGLCGTVSSRIVTAKELEELGNE